MLRRAFAMADVLSVHPTGLESRLAPTIVRAAHRAVFQYDPKPGMLYVRSRAISSRCNDNFDYFPAEEIKAAYRTFVGKPVFVNHHNDDHKRMRGLILDAALHEDRNPDGSPDTWAEVLQEIDGLRYPKLARALIRGDIDRTSMGCDVMSSTCNACGNVATMPSEYCAHIPGRKGSRIVQALADGRSELKLIYEECFPPETPILMADGTTASIHTVQSGDSVIDHLGNPRTVLQTMSRLHAGDLTVIERDGYWRSLRLTPNHPVLAIRRRRSIDNTRPGILNRLDAGRIAPEFIAAGELQVNDLIAEVIPNLDRAITKIIPDDWQQSWDREVREHPGGKAPDRYYTPPRSWRGRQHILRVCRAPECDTVMDLYPSDAARMYCSSKCWGDGYARNNSAHGGSEAREALPDSLALDHKFGRWCGWFLAEGSVHQGRSNGNSIRFALHREEVAHAEEITQLAWELFGLTARTTPAGPNGICVAVCSAPLARFMRSLGDDAYTKALPDEWLNSPIEFIQGVLSAHEDGDGEHGGGRVGGIQHESIHSHATSSPRLADQLYLMHLMVGHTPTRKKPDLPGGPSRRTVPGWFIRARSDQDARGRLSWNGWVFNRVRSVGSETYSGTVHNLEVADTHTYVADGIGVHNCRGLSFFENSLLVEPPADPTAFFTNPVELGPGLAHLAKSASIAPKPRAPLRLDKPVEPLPRGELARWQGLARNAALVSANSRVWRLLAEANSASRPARDLNGEIWRLLRQGNADSGEPGQDSEFLRNYPSDSEIDEKREGQSGLGSQEPWHPYRHELESRPEPRVGLPKQVKGEFKGPDVGTVYSPVPHGTKGAMNASSPYEEYHGPYEVMRHAQTGRYHVVDNQDRVTDYGGRNGMDDRFKAEHARDYAEHRQRSKEIARGIADKLWSGFQEAMDPGGTDESRESERNVRSMNSLQNLGYQPHHIKFDDEDGGRPYAEVEHTLPGGKKTGWFGVDHGGSGYLEIKHRATGDESHDVINLSQHESGQNFRKPGYGPDEAHADLHHWHSGPEEDTGGIRQYLEQNDPRIRRWKQRHGVRIRRDSAYVEPPWLRMVRTAYGEIKSPPDVDTLRDEACPICGNDTAYAGRECQVCGYILPIKPFADPDVDKARQLDQLRQTVDDQLLAADPSRQGAPFDDPAAVDPDSEQPVLGCPNCGETVEPEPPQTTDAPGVAAEEGPAAGDPCPNCGKAELEPVEQPDEDDEAEPDPDELDQDRDQLPDDEEQKDDKAKPKNPASSRSKAAKYRTSRTDEGDPGIMTTSAGLQALAAQQQLIESLQATAASRDDTIRTLIAQNRHQATQIQRLTAAVATLAQLGGVETVGRVKIAMLRKRADEQNPAQPIPEPAPQPPTQTTQQAKTPEAFADVTAPGMVPGSTQDVAADAVTTTYTPGQDIAAAPFHNLVDVTAPVDGTQGPRPINEVRTETDVRVGNPMNPQVAYPVGGPFAQTQRTLGSRQPALPQPPSSNERFTACLRLARLQIEAGIAEGEDLALAQRYARDVDNMPDAVVASNIGLLSQMRSTAAARPTAQPPRSLVPRTAGMGGVQRTLPSVPMMAQASLGAGAGDDDGDLGFIGLDLGD